ncbi:MAG: hypothetical protein ACNYZG_07160, partial [Gammaproteobacteria bacterium]
MSAFTRIITVYKITQCRFLIGIGLLSILLGTFEHQRDLRALRKESPDMPRSGTQLVAALMATFG